MRTAKNMNSAHTHGRMGDGSAMLEHLVAPVYSEDAVASLRFMIEEEKLAGDLYSAFYDQTGVTVFSHIARSEDQHMMSLITQAEFAGIDVSDLVSLPAGEYKNADLQTLYNELLATGSVSSDAALAVGQQVEQTDIADLTGAMAEVEGTPLVGVYAHLQAGSEHHLSAFDYYLSI